MNAAPPSSRDRQVVRVWDLPVRATHWAVALLIGFCWLSAREDWLAWHKIAGYAVLALVLFRLYWGFWGSTTARFSHFLRGPRAVLVQLRTLFSRKNEQAVIGHNPAGGWNIAAMLLLLLVQAGLGLFAVDEFGTDQGPLATYVNFDAGRAVADLHQILFNVLLVLIGLHIIAVLARFVFKRENLVTPMVTGVAHDHGFDTSAITFASGFRALVALSVCILLMAIVAAGF